MFQRDLSSLSDIVIFFEFDHCKRDDRKKYNAGNGRCFHNNRIKLFYIEILPIIPRSLCKRK